MNKKLDENVEQGKKLFMEEITDIANRIFHEDCVACGGNWNAMLWSGFKKYHENGELTDEEFEQLDKLSEELEGNGGVAEFCFLSEMAILMVVRAQLRLTKWGEQYRLEKYPNDTPKEK